MSHNLNVENGKVSFFSVKEKAWHGLGTVVKEALNSEIAIKLAGLDYLVKKMPNYIQLPDNSLKTSGNSFSTVRTDNYAILGDKLSEQYTVVQNSVAFDFFDDIVGKGEAIFETAGALGKGERIFITAKMPDYIRVKGNDVIEKYLLFSNSHDGSTGITVMFTPIRVVCNNTLQAALSDRSQRRVTIQHRSKAEEKLKQAANVLGITNQLSAELEQIFNRMAEVRLTDLQAKGFVTEVMMPETLQARIKAAQKAGNDELVTELSEISTRTQNTIDLVMDYYSKGEGQQLITTRGTVFGAYNAITGFYQNVKNFDTPEQKMLNNVFGNGYNKGQKALDLAATLIK